MSMCDSNCIVIRYILQFYFPHINLHIKAFLDNIGNTSVCLCSAVGDPYDMFECVLSHLQGQRLPHIAQMNTV